MKIQDEHRRAARTQRGGKRREVQHGINHPGGQSAMWKGVLGSLLLVALLAVIFGVGSHWFTGVLAARLGQGGGTVLLANLLWFAFICLLIWLPLHFLRRRRLHQWAKHPHQPRDTRHMGPWYDSMMDALDSIAAGNFDVLVQPANSSHYRYFDEISAKVNSMAHNLNNMENARQEFVSGVSHEIQSPLTSIGGFAALLKDPALEPEQRLHYLNIIENESQRLSKLGENLLKISMLDTKDAAALEKQPCRVDKQLGNVLLMLEPQWRAANLEVALEAGEATISADGDMLEQVWINLLHNAIKFTPVGGQIEVALAQEGDSILCTVRDTGCGMPGEVLPHVFETFYKGDKSRERAKGGNGLGLALAHKIVALHGGSITAQSTEGAGSTFTVRLPKE